MPPPAANRAAQIRHAREQIEKLLARSATDLELRAELLSDPRGAVARFTGRALPAGLDIRFIESQGDITVLLPPVAIDP